MNNEAACFIKYAKDKPIAFQQCRLRHDHAEGTESSPVGYLEGIFVAEGYRKKGYAAELLSECEKWAKEKGCSGFAGDRELDNADSIRFHMSLGFEEADRIICFRKDMQFSWKMKSYFLKPRIEVLHYLYRYLQIQSG